MSQTDKYALALAYRLGQQASSPAQSWLLHDNGVDEEDLSVLGKSAHQLEIDVASIVVPPILTSKTNDIPGPHGR
jgi:hypothetical protein